MKIFLVKYKFKLLSFLSKFIPYIKRMVIIDEQQMLKYINDYILLELKRYENEKLFEINRGTLKMFSKESKTSKTFKIEFKIRHLKSNIRFDFYLENNESSMKLPEIKDSSIAFEILKLYEKFEQLPKSYISNILRFVE